MSKVALSSLSSEWFSCLFFVVVVLNCLWVNRHSRSHPYLIDRVGTINPWVSISQLAGERVNFLFSFLKCLFWFQLLAGSLEGRGELIFDVHFWLLGVFICYTLNSFEMYTLTDINYSDKVRLKMANKGTV